MPIGEELHNLTANGGREQRAVKGRDSYFLYPKNLTFKKAIGIDSFFERPATFQ